MKRSILIVLVSTFASAASASAAEVLTGELTCIDSDATAYFDSNQAKTFATPAGIATIEMPYSWSDGHTTRNYSHKLELRISDTVRDYKHISTHGTNTGSGSLVIRPDNGDYYRRTYTVQILAEAKRDDSDTLDSESDQLSVTVVNEGFAFDTQVNITKPDSSVYNFGSVTCRGTAKSEPPAPNTAWEAVRQGMDIKLWASNGTWSRTATVQTDQNGHWSKTWFPPVTWNVNEDWSCTAELQASTLTKYGANTTYKTSPLANKTVSVWKLEIYGADFNELPHLPESWINVGGWPWETSIETGHDNFVGGDGNCAIADGTAWNGQEPFNDAVLASPTFDIPDAAALDFDAAYYDSSPGGDNAAVYLTFPTEQAPVLLLQWTESHSPTGPGERLAFDLSEYAGTTGAQILFSYQDLAEGQSDGWFEVDNVYVSGGYDPPLCACCSSTTGMCTDLPEMECAGTDETWHEGEECMTYPCPQPVGACCFADVSCEDLTWVDCAGAGGDWHEVEDCDSYLCPGPPPENDDCGSAISIGDVDSEPFRTTHGTFDGGGVWMTGPNVWYCHTASCTGVATVSLCGSEYDTLLAVYEGCTCGPLGSQLCGDDDSPCGVPSVCQVPVVAGQSYMVEIGGYGDEVGTGLLSISCALTGACCFPAGVCADVTGDDCKTMGGSYHGDGTECDATACAAIPAVSEWGLAAMTLLVLTAGTLVIAHRRRVFQGAG